MFCLGGGGGFVFCLDEKRSVPYLDEENKTRHEVLRRIKAGWNGLGKAPARQAIKKNLPPLYLTNSRIRMPNMVSDKSSSKGA